MDASFTPKTPVEAKRPVMVPYEQARYWRYCSFVLGAGFLLSLGFASGPSSAGASEGGSAFEDQNRSLSIGGFDSVSGEAVFVIVGSDGERVGVLPMAGRSEAIESQNSAD